MLCVTVRPEFIEGFSPNGPFILRQAQYERIYFNGLIMTQLLRGNDILGDFFLCVVGAIHESPLLHPQIAVSIERFVLHDADSLYDIDNITMLGLHTAGIEHFHSLVGIEEGNIELALFS